MSNTATENPRAHVGKLVYLKGEALGTTCAVPASMVNDRLEVDLDQYLFTGWASRNCGLNPNGIGSHLFPKVPSELVSADVAARYKEQLRKIGRIAD